ncbi:hypothetical protein MSNKSG1_00696 [Marinobacter santoriniensis NKSG1]|uniref:Uncharacterized protein n=1 Tax=Marinobacter santoriniensis NKSG1 TaxID=1288826 RepID=M7CZ05_9GAMM|nr:transporter substrate-binding domain-containing protein [Marinobacter santoriniensis]EMP57480.1 hypothetical protein MSNKSG1_00696 [Marinobacter santoriniensis NKSG1]
MMLSRLFLRAFILWGATGWVPAQAADHTLTIVAPELPGSSEAGGVGRDAELVAATLRECGYSAKFIVQPFGRHMLTYRQSLRGDAVMTVPLYRNLPGYSTSAYIWYQNGAYYDSERVGPINTIADLKGLNVVTFNDGIKILGLEALVPYLGEVHENTNQRIHSHLLFLGRVDVILADGLIVAEVNHRIREQGLLPKGEFDLKNFRFAPIFNPTPYKMVFREPGLARAFDECFDRLYRKGTVTVILEKYLAPYQGELMHRYLSQ